MTDEEIIKAFKCCGINGNCTGCPLRWKICTDINVDMLVLDLINRRDAEIERLCMELDEVIIAKDLLFDEAEALIKKAKADAIKEFAEMVEKLKYPNAHEPKGFVIYGEDFDSLVKEMVGDDK